jgi:hypothetical protein
MDQRELTKQREQQRKQNQMRTRLRKALAPGRLAPDHLSGFPIRLWTSSRGTPVPEGLYLRPDLIFGDVYGCPGAIGTLDELRIIEKDIDAELNDLKRSGAGRKEQEPWRAMKEKASRIVAKGEVILLPFLQQRQKKHVDAFSL